jgi:hypothetical protein
VRHLRQLRASSDVGARMRRVQLRLLCWPLRHLRRCRHQRRVLLQRVHNAGERRALCVLLLWVCGRHSDARGAAPCPVQRDGCPKIVNLGSAKTDLFYERKKCACCDTARAGCVCATWLLVPLLCPVLLTQAPVLTPPQSASRKDNSCLERCWRQRTRMRRWACPSRQ